VENQSEDVESPHAQDPTPQRDSGSILHKLGLLHLLEKGGEIPQLDKQIMKVLKSKGGNVEDFFVDIFKSKMKSPDALL